MTIKRIKNSCNIFFACSFVCAFLLMLSGAASAHLPVAVPDKFTAAPGDAVNISAGLAEPLIKFGYSPENLLAAGYAGKFAELTGQVWYTDGPGGIIQFSPENQANPENSLFDKASVHVEKPGTSVIAMRFDFNSGDQPTVGYGKTLLNWGRDDGATKRVGGDDVLEIVQTSATGPLASGDVITVKVYLRGRELPNAEASATYDGAPTGWSTDEPENNEYLHANTDSSGNVKFTLDRPGTWVVGMEYIDETAPKNKPEYDEEEGYNEWKGVRYRATLVFNVDDEPRRGSGGGGCAAGSPALLSLALLAAAMRTRVVKKIKKSV
ncbi:MAG: DUF4198 domain-containing protein [Synergistaceae bacterium]|nr:DUF4198 domain-containing protein [Synergistaceae bacterium]